MELEAFISFFLLLHLRKTVQVLSPHPLWERRLKVAMIVIGVAFVLDGAVRGDTYTQWMWHAAVLWVISLAFRYPLFFPTRTTMYAVLPLAVVSILSNSLKTLVPLWRQPINQYSKYAFPVAVTWMIALLILSRRQLKALKVEHRTRLQEEEERRQMEQRRVELEALVAERTAELVAQKEELHHALEHLKSTQDQLVQKEKMASLGELTAGIAHEIQNPLNFVNNFSELSVELAQELRDFLSQSGLSEKDKAEVDEMLEDLIQNQKKIHHHGGRADAIVKAMLQHSRKDSGHRELTDINELADEYVRLTYHGIRAKDKSFSAALHTEFDENAGNIAIVPQEIGRVLINVLNNAFYAVSEKKKKLNGTYEPAVLVRTSRQGDQMEITVKDNGPGIPAEALEKIYQPFFTTKPTGEGTGLGLSLSYDIITKGHGGELRVETKEGAGTEFKIILPAKSN